MLSMNVFDNPPVADIIPKLNVYHIPSSKESEEVKNKEDGIATSSCIEGADLSEFWGAFPSTAS